MISAENKIFSIVIPLFNAGKTVERTLRSCAVQTYTNFEIIIVDDASTDDSVNIVKNFIHMHPCLSVKLLHNKLNMGSAFSRNLGWNYAEGKYIAFLDADDYWHPKKLELILSYMEKYSIKIIGHGYDTVINENLHIWKQPDEACVHRISFLKLLTRNFAVTPSVVILRIVEERFNESMRYAEDHEFWLRLAHRYDIYYVDFPLVTLGRVPMLAGGLSGNHLAMRRGEIYMYFLAAHYSAFVFVTLPLLIIFSLSKHLFGIFRRNWMNR